MDPPRWSSTFFSAALARASIASFSSHAPALLRHKFSSSHAPARSSSSRAHSLQHGQGRKLHHRIGLAPAHIFGSRAQVHLKVHIQLQRRAYSACMLPHSSAHASSSGSRIQLASSSAQSSSSSVPPCILRRAFCSVQAAGGSSVYSPTLRQTSFMFKNSDTVLLRTKLRFPQLEHLAH